MDPVQQNTRKASTYLPRSHWWALVDQLDAALENDPPNASMKARRAHKISRNGCGVCKRRRVKVGPACPKCSFAFFKEKNTYILNLCFTTVRPFSDCLSMVQKSWHTMVRQQRVSQVDCSIEPFTRAIPCTATVLNGYFAAVFSHLLHHQYLTASEGHFTWLECHLP